MTGSERISRHIGCIFYRYETEDADSLIRYRVLGIQNTKTCKVLDISTKEIKKIDCDYLMDNFKIVSSNANTADISKEFNSEQSRTIALLSKDSSTLDTS